MRCSKLRQIIVVTFKLYYKEKYTQYIFQYFELMQTIMTALYPFDNLLVQSMRLDCTQFAFLADVFNINSKTHTQIHDTKFTLYPYI